MLFRSPKPHRELYAIYPVCRPSAVPSIKNMFAPSAARSPPNTLLICPQRRPRNRPQQGGLRKSGCGCRCTIFRVLTGPGATAYLHWLRLDPRYSNTLRSAAIPQLRFAQGGNLQTTDEVNPIEATLIRVYPVWITCDKG